MLRKTWIALVAMLGVVAGSAAMLQDAVPPKTKATSPAACLQEVRDYAAKRQQEMIASTAPPANQPSTPESTLRLNQLRAPMVTQINQARVAMAKECASRFDGTAGADSALVAMADLYTEAGQPEKARAFVDRALTVKTFTPAERAALLVFAVRTVLREPVSDARNARLEGFVDELDSSSSATIEQRLDAHVAMNGWYRYDDVDAGIIKHSTWIIETVKKLTPAQRVKYGPSAVGAYVNLAQALAGQGMNDKALATLSAAKTEMADVPTVARSVDPEIARLKLVGTPGAAITAPRWLNMPAGKTELAMPGSVTLLEFSAHWCVACKESYPGVNRLRAKYGSRGFRAVLVTKMFGYFEQERNLTPEAEYERDRGYFASHEMDVPVAVGDRSTQANPDPNDVHYKVGGIPQIHLVDKKGNIRLVMVGYDDANESKLAKLIEDLLKEK